MSRAAGLLDELELMTYPVIAGKGARLFDDGEVLRRLELTACKHTRSGIVITTYRPGPVPA
ncbi:dihydrofolate reductase family protein [Nocardia cyriacigeorgica]|nr:dihydrofolate reductase family protein [Nocardia cyriacigeorgica]MBF6532920.1 dihydrofolate reductase family protein [Nocardia cyriacigeorgica]